MGPKSQIFDGIGKANFLACEDEAKRLLSLLVAGRKAEVGDDTQELETSLECIFCDLFELADPRRGYWSDGVVIEHLQLQSCYTIFLQGYTWCSESGLDASQWRVPVQVRLVFSAQDFSHLEHLDVLMGEAHLRSLYGHKSWKWKGEPTEWLLRFHVLRPPISKPDPTVLVGELHVWTTHHPNGQIVGPDWLPMTLEQAETYIRGRTREDHEVLFEETWLDGAAAIKLG